MLNYQRVSTVYTLYTLHFAFQKLHMQTMRADSTPCVCFPTSRSTPLRSTPCALCIRASHCEHSKCTRQYTSTPPHPACPHVPTFHAQYSSHFTRHSTLRNTQHSLPHLPRSRHFRLQGAALHYLLLLYILDIFNIPAPRKFLQLLFSRRDNPQQSKQNGMPCLGKKGDKRFLFLPRLA